MLNLVFSFLLWLSLPYVIVRTALCLQIIHLKGESPLLFSTEQKSMQKYNVLIDSFWDKNSHISYAGVSHCVTKKK